MRKNLVTGGAGFIGSHLAELLVSRGEQVAVIDDLSTGRLENLSRLSGNPALEIVIESVLNETLVDRLVTQADRVFHLAAAVGVDLIVRQPAQAIETNILGTTSVLHACRRYLRPAFLASTSEVYGKSEAVPFREDSDIVLGPTSRSRWSYACSKAIDEFVGLAYAKDHHVPVVIGRFFNTTGPRQSGQYGMVVPRFVAQALRDEPITVYGSGDQRRCFAHVQDIVEATVALVETAAARGQVVNLGTPHSVTMNELAGRVKEMTGSRSAITHVPFELAYSEGFEDIFVREPDISKARALIRFDPARGLNEILSDVIQWERARLASGGRQAPTSGSTCGRSP